MSVLSFLPYASGVAGIVIGVIGVRMAMRRDKDAVMTQQNKDIREIMIDMGTLKESLKHVASREDISRVEAKVDQLINKSGA